MRMQVRRSESALLFIPSVEFLPACLCNQITGLRVHLDNQVIVYNVESWSV